MTVAILLRLASILVLEAREQAVLDAGVKGFSSNDQPGPLGPIRQLDQVGELDDRGPFPILSVLFDRLVPDLLEPQRVEDCAVYLGI
jgi:hypothetical protein